MKTKYKRFNSYLRDEHKRDLLIMKQELSSRTDWSIFDRNWTLMKLKRNNINKAMKRLQLYKARNKEVHLIVEEVITEEYNKKHEV